MTRARSSRVHHAAWRALVTMMLGLAMFTVPMVAGAMQSPAVLNAEQRDGEQATRAWGLSQVLVWRNDVVLTVVMAMVSAIVLAIPIAHVYRLSKHRHEYDPAVTETILILPAVVAAIVIVVQGSLALSFSLVGVAAAVRFRSNLKDTNDAMFIFFAIALGIAAAVKGFDMAFAMCVVFYATAFAVSRRRNAGSHPADERHSAAHATSGDTSPDGRTTAGDGAHVLSPRPDDPHVARDGAITVRAADVRDAESARAAVEARLTEESRRWELAEVL